MARPKRVYVAMEGGGARGVAHVGALRALQAAEASGDLRILGYAGTSAGAIVAALAAVDYGADEILDPTRRRHILDLVSPPPGPPPGPASRFVELATGCRAAGAGGWRATDMLGPGGWPALRRLIDEAARYERMLTGARGRLGWLARAARAYGRAPISLWRFRAMFGAGLVSLDPLRDLLQKALALRLHGHPGGPTVTFADLPLPLKIVTTNVTRRALRLFPESAADRQLAVADVVAASACIPFLFGSRLIGTERHVDGGLVSNLPAWAFDHELRLDEDAAVVACQIVAPGAADPGHPGIGDFVRTAVFGGAKLNLRNIPDLYIAALDPRIDVLALDACYDTLRAALDDAEQVTLDQVVVPAVLLPAAFRELTRAAMADLLASINARRAKQAPPGNRPYPGVLRGAIAVPFGEPEIGLRLRYSVGYDASADDKIALPIDGSIAGAGLHAPVYHKLDGTLPPGLTLSDPQHRMARNRLLAVPRAFVVAMPILIDLGRGIDPGQGHPHVLVLDGTEATGLNDDEMTDLAQEIMQAVQTSVTRGIKRSSR